MTRAANDEGYVCYTVNEKRKMTHVTHHDSWEEGFAKALEHYRGFAEEPGFVKAEDDSFHYGPVSDYRSVEETLRKDELRRAHEANPPYLETEGSLSKCGPKGHKWQYSLMMEEPKKHVCACMKWLPDGSSHSDGKYGDLLKVIEASVNESLDGRADVKADWFWKDKHFSYNKKTTCDVIHVSLLSNKELDFDKLSSPVADLFQKMDGIAETSSYVYGVEGYVSAYKDHMAENDFAAAVSGIPQTDAAMEQ